MSLGHTQHCSAGDTEEQDAAALFPKCNYLEINLPSSTVRNKEPVTPCSQATWSDSEGGNIHWKSTQPRRKGWGKWAAERAKCSKDERMMRLECLVCGVRNDLENRDDRGGEEED